MGVVSRQILPVCSSLCCFCPSLRSRSRHPIKRYKQLIAEILPRNQEAEPNDRKIGKLCEYASKNPLRIPKINETLDQRFYKELRYGNFGSVKVVMCIYGKLLSSCREQTPLFASTLLGIVRTLLEQSEHEDLQIVACYTLVDFINSQTDATHMFNLEGLIPTLCQLSGAGGGEQRTKHLRSAGLQSLASMVGFMGEQSHVSMDFDKIVSVVLENYTDCQRNVENPEDDLKKDVNVSTFTDDCKNHSVDISESPSYWSRICLHNMAKQAKEVTTIRRILELLFNNFNANNHWSLEKGVAYSVLMYLQCFLEETGENSHVLLSMLVKHLDHKNVCKQPLVQIDMVKVATLLAEKAKQEVTVALLGAISDLMKHLRKCLQNSAESSSSLDETQRRSADLQISIEKCILQLSKKVGDVGPILDGMAVFLENISSPTVVARMTVSAVLHMVRIIASVPNIAYQKKAFPDALFHQLLIGMAHPDPETRVKSLDVFSAVLMPSLPSPRSEQNVNGSAVAPERTSNGSCILQDESDVNGFTNEVLKEGRNQLTECKSHGRSDSFESSITNRKSMPLMRLSSHQIDLLLSSIWVQATSPENVPANYEAIAQAYNIALLFTRSKASSHVALVRCFQLAISLKRMALDQEGGLRPSHRRSLINLASYMLILSAKAGNLPELIPLVKASLTEKMADPHLHLVDDFRLKAVFTESDCGKTAYGSEDDNIAASESLSAVESYDHQLKEAIKFQLMMKFANISEDELSDLKKQLLQEFSPDDSLPLGPLVFMDTPRPCSPLAQMELETFERATSEAALTDDEAFSEPNGRLSDSKASLSTNADGVLSVNELLQSVSQTAQQVASSHISSTPVPYDEMKNQCEALVTGKKEKMSVLQSFKHQPDSKVFPSKDEKQTSAQDLKTEDTENNLVQHNWLAIQSPENDQSSFRLPPASPYEKFLKASEL